MPPFARCKFARTYFAKVSRDAEFMLNLLPMREPPPFTFPVSRIFSDFANKFLLQTDIA